MKKPFVLTPSEEDLMNIFWVENRPLTSVELTELSKDHGWNQEYILNMLRSIKKKGMDLLLTKETSLSAFHTLPL